MGGIFFGLLTTVSVIFIVPFIIYGLFSALWGLKPPEGVAPARFLLGIFVSKLGTAVVFTFLFYLSKEYALDHWIEYAGIWWIMFVLGEIGQLLGPNYTWKEALAGIISESVYLPVSSFLLSLLIK